MRDYALRLVCVVLGLAGAVIMVVLVATGPELTLRDVNGVPGTGPDQVVSCYSSFQVPDGLPRGNLGVSTDSLLNGVDPLAGSSAAIEIDNTCERLRSSRLATALLIGVPTVLLLAVALLARPQNSR